MPRNWSTALLVEHAADLFEAEAEVTQRQDAMQPAELRDSVRAVARRAVDAFRPEQTDLVVVPQHAR